MKKDQPLLKDILFEKVESSYTFKKSIADALAENEIGDEDACIISDELIHLITEFINQNYTSKTNEANPQLQKTTIRF